MAHVSPSECPCPKSISQSVSQTVFHKPYSEPPTWAIREVLLILDC